MKKHRNLRKGIACILAVLLGLGTGIVPGEESVQAAGIVQEGDGDTLHPDKYLFVPGLSSNMTAEPYGVTEEEMKAGAAAWNEPVVEKCFIVPVTAEKKGFGILYKNAGTYKRYDSQGQVQETVEVDLRVTCTQVIGPRNNWYTMDGTKKVPPTIKFYKNSIAMSIQSMKAATFRYEFLLHGTETPITQVLPDFGGHATVVDLDGCQKIAFEDTTNLQAVYKSKDNPHLQVTDHGTSITSDSQSTTPQDENGWLTVLYSGSFSLTFYYSTHENFQTDDSADKQCVVRKQSNGSYMSSYYAMLPGMSIGGFGMQRALEKRVGPKGTTWNKAGSCQEQAAAYPIEEYREFDYLIQHKTTPQKNVVKYELRDTLEACLDIDHAGKVRILNKSGENVTGKFLVSVEEDVSGRKTIVCSARPEYLETEAFFNHEEYTFCFTVHRKENLDVDRDMGKWLDESDGYTFYIPNEASLSWEYANGLAENVDSNVCWVTDRIRCDLVIEKDAKYDGWQVGDLVEYTVEVTQTRQDGYARNVVITDEDIPSYLRLVNNQWQVTGPGHGGQAPSISSRGENGWQVTCPLLKAGESIVVHFVCQALEESNGRDTLNTAYATAENFLDGDGEQRAVGDQAEIWVNSPELTVEKIADHYEWQVGQPVEYQVVVKNRKDYTIAENVIISDINLPEGLALAQEEGSVQISMTPDSLWETVGIPVADGTSVIRKNTVGNQVSLEQMGDGWTVRIARLPSQASVQIRFFCIATEAANGLEVQNQVYVQGDNIPETGDDARVFINTAALTVDKTADHYEWQVGEQVEYKVVVNNVNTLPGSSIARNVDVYDMNLPHGLVLAEGEDAIQVYGIPAQVEEFREWTPDVPNQINGELYGERMVRDISWEMVREENGWHLHISDLPAGYPVEILFRCLVTEEVNGQEAVNLASVTAQNSSSAQDDAKVYINTAALSLEKSVYNPWYTEDSSRFPYEFRVGEEIIYQVVVRNMQKGSIARNLVVEDVSLPAGIVLANVENPITVEGIPSSIINPVTGVDPANEINQDHYKETEVIPVDYSLEPNGAGYILRVSNLPCTEGDELNSYVQPLVITCHCVATEEVNGWEIVNTARAYADNGTEVRDSERIWINSPILRGEKRSDRELYCVGDTITYTIDLYQDAVGCAARNVTVTDLIDTPGVKLQKNSIVLLDAQGRKIEPAQIQVQDNSFWIDTGRSLIREIPYNAWDIAQGGLRQMDTWNPADIPLEPKMTIEYAVEIVDADLAGSVVHNGITVDCEEQVPIQAEETVEIAGPALDVSKEADKRVYRVGESGFFQLTIRELRDEVMARNVVIEDTMDTLGAVLLPDRIVLRLNGEEQTPLSLEAGASGFRMETGLSIGIEDKLEVFYEVSYQASELDGRVITNWVTVKGDNTKEAGADCQVQIQDQEPMLTIEKTSDRTQYKPCETGHYQVLVSQIVPDAIARNVILKDTILDGAGNLVKGSLTLVNHLGTTVDQAEIEEREDGYVIYTGQDLAYGESFLITYDVKFEKIAEASSSVFNVARATADNLDPVALPGEEPVQVADGLEAVKTSEPPTGTLVKNGDEIIYSITLYNRSQEEKKNILVKDAIPEHGSFQKFLTEGSKESMELKELEGREYAAFYLPNLLPGEEKTVSFSIQVQDASSEDWLVNVAQVRTTRAEQNELTKETWTSEEFRNTNETIHYLDTLWVADAHEVTVRQTLVPSVTPSPSPAGPSPTGKPDQQGTPTPEPSPTGQPLTPVPKPTGAAGSPTAVPRPTATVRPTTTAIPTWGVRPTATGTPYSYNSTDPYYGGKTASAARTGDRRPFAAMAVILGVGVCFVGMGIFANRRRKR